MSFAASFTAYERVGHSGGRSAARPRPATEPERSAPEGDGVAGPARTQLEAGSTTRPGEASGAPGEVGDAAGEPARSPDGLAASVPDPLA